jgi:hypothetical protein
VIQYGIKWPGAEPTEFHLDRAEADRRIAWLSASEAVLAAFGTPHLVQREHVPAVNGSWQIATSANAVPTETP